MFLGFNYNCIHNNQHRHVIAINELYSPSPFIEGETTIGTANSYELFVYPLHWDMSPSSNHKYFASLKIIHIKLFIT